MIDLYTRTKDLTTGGRGSIEEYARELYNTTAYFAHHEKNVLLPKWKDMSPIFRIAWTRTAQGPTDNFFFSLYKSLGGFWQCFFIRTLLKVEEVGPFITKLHEDVNMGTSISLAQTSSAYYRLGGKDSWVKPHPLDIEEN